MLEQDNYWIRAVTVRRARRTLLRGVATFGGGYSIATLAGCSSHGSVPSSPPSSLGSGQPRDVTIKVSDRRPFATIDPVRETGSLYGQMMGVMESLTWRANDGTIQPGLATGWKFDGDGLGITWDLRRNVQFHNGDSFTADDVVYTWNEYIKKEFNPVYRAVLILKITDVKKLGESQVYMKFNAPMFELPNEVESYLTILPKTYVEKVGHDRFATEPVGTGPFKVLKAVPNGDWDLEAFADYWGPKPSMKRVSHIAAGEATSRVSMLQAGQLDIADDIPPVLVEGLKRDPNISIISFPSILAAGLTLNILDKSQPLSDLRVRQALNYAVNRQLIVDKIYRGYAAPATIICPPGFAEACPGSAPAFAYDPGKAKALMAEAGYPNGVQLGEALMFAPYNAPELIEALRQNFQEIGVTAQWNPLPVPALVEKRAAKKHAVCHVVSENTTYDAGADLVRHFHSSSTLSLTNNPDWDHRIETAVNTSDKKERDKAVEEALLYFHGQATHVMLFYQNYIIGVRKDRIASFAIPKGWSTGPRNIQLATLK